MKKVIYSLLAMLMISPLAIAQQKSIKAPLTKENAMKVAHMKGAPKASNFKTFEAKGSTKSIISTFPYVENFETTNSDWTFVDNDNDGNGWTKASALEGTLSAHSGSDCMTSASYDNNTGVLTPDNWMISSQIQIPASATNYELSWWDAAQDPSYPEDHYSVYIATSNTVSAFNATTPVFQITLSSDVWAKRSVDLSAYAGQNIYIAFRHHACTDQYIMKIDDIRIGGPSAPEISIIAPTVAESNTLVTLTANVSSATSFSWTINGATPSTSSDYTVQATWTTPGSYSIIATASNSVGTASDTAEIEIYECATIDEFPYTANLSADLGCWTNRSDSTEDQGWFPSTMVEGINEGSVVSFSAQSIFGIFMMDVPTDNWLTSPQIEIPSTGDYELSWNVKPFDPNYTGDNYSVYVLVNNVPTQVFTENVNGMSSWSHRIVSLSDYAGQTIRIAFRHHDSQGGYILLLDQITLSTLSAPYLTLQGSEYAKVNEPYTIVANCSNADSYAWYVDGISVDGTSNTFTTSFTTAGEHSIAVSASNSVGSTQDTMHITAIECTSISAPFTEDFENQILCWTMMSNDPANNDRFGIFPDESGNNVFAFSSYSEAEDYNQYLITPELNLTGDNLAVKFSYMGTSENENFKVLYSTTGNSISDFTHELANFTTTPTEWNQFGAMLPANAKYICINYYAEYQYDLLIDDFEISEAGAPSVSLIGPATALKYDAVTINANAMMAESFSWTIDGTPTDVTTNSLQTVFTTSGMHSIEVTASNNQGSASASLNIRVLGDTIYYDNGEVVDAIGTGAEIYWGIKFEAATLQDRNFLTDVFFYIFEGNTGNYDLRIHQGGANAPQTKVYEESINVTQADCWKNVHLKQSVALDQTKPLWIILHTTNIANPAAACAYVNNVNSCWASVDGQQWSSIQEASQGQLSYSWMIRALTGDHAMGISNLENDVNIYPNPTTGILNIEIEGIKNVEIIDLNGRMVMQTSESSVDMSNLSNGVYMVRIITNNGVAVKKIVKM